MNLHSIEDFLAIAEAASLSEAAEKRHISISALSRRLAALEDWLGAPLVDRQRRPHELTYAGYMFRDIAFNVVHSLYEVRDNFRRGMPGRNIVTFALPHTLRDRFFPEFLAELSSSDHTLEVQLVVATEAARLYEILDKGACDFLLYYSRPETPFSLPRGHISAYCADDELVPVSVSDRAGNAAFPLPGKPDKYTPHLSQGAGSYFMELIGDLVRRSRRAPYLAQLPHTEGSEPFLQSVMNGKGIAWLPRRLVEPHLAEGRLAIAGTPEWRIPLQIRLARKMTHLGEAAEAIWSGWQEHVTGRAIAKK